VPYFHWSSHQFPVDHVLLPPYVTGVGPATHLTGRRLLRCDRVYSPRRSAGSTFTAAVDTSSTTWIFQVQPDDPIEVDVEGAAGFMSAVVIAIARSRLVE
jgi:hypothetical protein